MLPSDIHWPSVRLGLGVAAAGTLTLGTGLLLWSGSMWWLAAAGLASLFLGGALAGRRSGTAEPLNGAVVGGLYFAGVAAVLFGGEVATILPDPLPGLPRGDSTFFFVWPLGQLGASTLGSVVGGRLARR